MGAVAGYVGCSQGIQDLEFREAKIAVEIDNHFDGSLVSRDHVHRFLHAEPPHLGMKSSGAVPFTTIFALLVLWFGISVPLVFLEAYFAI